jgi:hypothetical protein
MKSMRKTQIYDQPYHQCILNRWNYKKSTNIRLATLYRQTQIMFWNANGAANERYLLPEFVAGHRIRIALTNDAHLHPTRKWIIRTYTIHQTEVDISHHIGSSHNTKIVNSSQQIKLTTLHGTGNHSRNVATIESYGAAQAAQAAHRSTLLSRHCSSTVNTLYLLAIITPSM